MAEISFIIPAYNEELLLPKTLRSIDESCLGLPGDYEIVVSTLR